jgi:hypothetical protein
MGGAYTIMNSNIEYKLYTIQHVICSSRTSNLLSMLV